MKITFPATPHQAGFIRSKAYLNFFIGPRGEGKTTSGFFATLTHALEHPQSTWPIRWAVVRDTWENLKLTTVPSIRMCVREYNLVADGLDRIEPKVASIGARFGSGLFQPMVELNFFGLDRPEDANRLQGFEAGGAWIEEPAPAADIASGIPEDSMLTVTSLRQKNVRPRVQITMNPPDATHWTMKYRDDPDVVAGLKKQGIDIGFFAIPPGENPGVTEEYRKRNRAILEAMGRFDLIARLVEGKVGYVQLGEAVTPEYNPDIHDAKFDLPILMRVPLIRSWDAGLNPCTVFWQITPHGRIFIFKSLRSQNAGMEAHIAQRVIPWMVDHGVVNHVYEDIGDPAMIERDKASAESTSLDAIQAMLRASPGRPAAFIPGPIPIPDRVDPIRVQLSRNNGHGQPVIQIDPEALELKRALGGGWHRAKTPSGIIMPKPVKNDMSEHGDALGYGFGVKFPVQTLLNRQVRYRPREAAARAERAKAWMTA